MHRQAVGAEPWRTGLGRLALLCGFALLLMRPAAAGDEFETTQLSGRMLEEAFVIDAQIAYRFSDEAIDALQNGVPLTLVVELRLRRESAAFWEPDLLIRQLSYRIRYHTLGQLFQVDDLERRERQSFVTLEAAIDALGTIDALPVIARADLAAGEKYRLRLRSSLDVDALPLPLRPIAYLSPAWNLSSDWQSCSVRP